MVQAYRYYGIAAVSMPPKKWRKKSTKFLKRNKLSMIEELRKQEKCSDVVEKCVIVV